MTNLLIGFYFGGVFVTFLVVEAPFWERVLSAAIWPTFPLWPFFWRPF